MKNHRNTFKVAAFAALSIAGLLYLSLGTGKFHLHSPGYRIYAIFDDTAGLNINGPVMLNGMEIGRVQEMQIVYDGNKARVKLTLLIRPEIKIGAAPVPTIKTLGFMGEKYVHLAVRNKDDGFLAPGTLIEGKTPADLDAFFAEAQTLSANANTLIMELKGVASRLNTDALSKTVTNVGNATGELAITLKNNQETINRIITNLESASKNFEQFSDDIKRHPWKLLVKTKGKK